MQTQTSLLTAAWKGVKQNLLPGLILQVIAVSLILGYYMVPPMMDFLASVAVLKTNNGFLFSAVSTALFGGLIPYLLLLLTGQIQRGQELPQFFFYLFFWAYKGIEVDGLYTLQGVIFGTEPNFWTVVKKVLVDQFGYNVFWAAPTITLFFLWKDCQFSFRKLKGHLNKRLFTFKIPSLLLSAWIVWIPAVSIIYAFPQALQIPMFNIVLCFWVLMISFINRFNHDIDKVDL
ncbi:MAG: hypothetical protein JW969_05615 [Spirochaetales bacterium]|nr:hypothetical protein [Spirochaetales bacterium]